MKKFLSIALVCLLTVGALSAQFISGGRPSNSEAKFADSKATGKLSYCTNDVDSSIGTNSANSFNAAITFSAAQMNSFIGTNLTIIRVGLGDAPGFSAGKVWISRTKDGAKLYEQAFTAKAGWNEVTLTTPYTIDEGTFAIGYDITVTGGYPLGVSSNTQNASNGGNIAIGGQWTTLAANKLAGNLCIVGIAEGDFPEVLDLGMKSANLPKYLKANTDFTLKGTVINEGNVNITSYDVNYTVNGGEVKTQSFTGANISQDGTANFQLTTPFNVAEAGKYTVEFYVSNINGKPNDDNASNNTLSKTVSVYVESVPRKTVLEHFTTEKCPNCPAAENYLKGLVGNNKNIIWVHNHCGYYTDQYTIKDGESYMWFFNDGGSSYAPAIMLDRVWYAPDGDPGPVFFPASTYTPALIDESLATPAFVTVNINGTLDEAARKIDFTVSGNKIMDLAGDNTVLTVWFIEDDLKSSQSGISKHESVLRKVVSKVWGDPIVFDGNNYTKDYSVSIDSKFVIDNMKVVAFLSNYDKNDPNNCNIYNGESKPFKTIHVSVKDAVEELAVSVYPNPAKNVITIEGEYKTLSIVDITGKTVKVVNAESTIDVSALNNGMYILNIVGENGTKTQKLVINK